MKEKRTRPSTFAAGASILTKGGCTSNCQPTHTSVYPSFIRKPSPKSAAASWILTSGRAAIEAAQQPLASSIGDLEQQRAVALLRVNRTKDVQVGREVDAPICAARGVLEVDDARVVLVGGIERELDRAGELLVRSDLSKRLASGDDGAIGDRHLRDLGARARRWPDADAQTTNAEDATSHEIRIDRILQVRLQPETRVTIPLPPARTPSSP